MTDQDDRPKVKRGPDGRYLKGTPSPNPSGKPKGAFALTKEIQAQLDVVEWCRVLIEIMRGNGVRVTDAEGGGALVVTQPGPKDQIAAAKLLAEHGFVKPPTQKQLAIDDGRAPRVAAFQPELLDDAQLEQLEMLLAAGGDDGEDDE